MCNSIYKVIHTLLLWNSDMLWFFFLHRQEKTISAPFPFEDKRLGQQKSTFRRNINMVHTIQQNPFAFVPGRIGQENVNFKTSMSSS